MTRAIHSAPTLLTVSAAATVAALLVAGATGAAAQTRWNKTIEVIEAGGAAVANEHWRFIDMEHAPFSAERLYAILTEMDENRDADGRMSLTPLVRIPQDGDEDFKWAVKQVLDLGGFGIILPHVDRGEEAVRLVQAMRYPPARGSAAPEPRGERGWGPGGATRLWGLNSVEYHARADVWPLAPDGELFAVAMIESQEAVDNIQDILAAPISAIMVVPGDMAIDLGLGPNPPDRNHPEVDAAFQTVLEACLAQDRVICGLGDGASRLQQRLDEGWRFVLPLGG
jgi:4-hydroxy-2-oxoheptanedioate aldolase